MRLHLLAVVALLTLTMCASPSIIDPSVVTIEGAVSVRGNEPFTALMLETDQQNVYVLSFEGDLRAELQREAPGLFRVTGTLYQDDWNGKPYAFIRVRSWENLSR